jgi:Ca2+-binding RTX toxin-like protein
MTGGLGSDTYVVDSASDTIVEQASQGTDSVISSITFDLTGKQLEKLTLTGTAAINATGNDFSNVITGNSATNALVGWGGDDFLTGGTGNDHVGGQSGNDHYIFRKGDGADNMNDMVIAATTAPADVSAANALNVRAGGIVNTWVGGYAWHTSSNSLLKLTDGGQDTIDFEGIGIDDLAFSWSGEALVINTGGGNSVTIAQQAVAAARIEKMSFAPGSSPTHLATTPGVTAPIAATTFTVASAAGATLNGDADGTMLFGLSGNELLNALGGNDILMGGAGNDTMTGGTGNDSYYFGAGDGADTLVESGTTADADQLIFGAGLDFDELWFQQQGNNLVISVLGTDDKVTVNSWFSSSGNVVETLKSGDGRVLNHADVASLVSAMAAFQPSTASNPIGIQPDDPLLGDLTQTGTIAAAMNSAWKTAA